MRFKIKKSDRPKHTELVACVGWSNIENGHNELYSIGDDQQIWKWDINGEPVSNIFEISNFFIKESKLMDIDAQVIAMDWFPTAKGSQEVLAIGCADGSIKLMSKTGRIEKNVPEAH